MKQLNFHGTLRPRSEVKPRREYFKCETKEISQLRQRVYCLDPFDDMTIKEAIDKNPFAIQHLNTQYDSNRKLKLKGRALIYLIKAVNQKKRR